MKNLLLRALSSLREPSPKNHLDLPGPQQQKREAIRLFCRQRGIRTLLHFTRIENLASILEHGLLGKETLRREFPQQAFIFNDDFRIDGCENAICLSIGFPNYKMFYKYSAKNPQAWVVLRLKPDILWELDCLFCHENAASNAVRHLGLDERRELKALEKMFSSETVDRKRLQIPDEYPTNPQAEVLVFAPIAKSFIQGIYTTAAMPDLPQPPGILLTISQRFFEPRSDYYFWEG